MNESYVIGGIYRHSNVTVNQYVNDLENALVKFDNKTTTIFAGDTDIDLNEFENDNMVKFLRALLSNQYLSYVTLSTQLNQIMSCIFYCEITDHLPCFLSIKIKLSNDLKRPLTRMFTERNCTRFIEAMGNENRNSVFTAASDWYSIFVAKVKQKFKYVFRWYKSRVKDF